MVNPAAERRPEADARDAKEEAISQKRKKIDQGNGLLQAASLGHFSEGRRQMALR
jgi:hypothetical protein